MPKFKNVSPLGDLFVLGRDVKSGEVIEVPEADAEGLKAQPDVWAVVKETKENS